MAHGPKLWTGRFARQERTRRRLRRRLREPHEACRERIRPSSRRYAGAARFEDGERDREAIRGASNRTRPSLETPSGAELRDCVFALIPSKVTIRQLERVVGHEV